MKIRFNTNVTPIAMKAMKINIPVQRKTSIESNRNPESKDQNSKVEILWAVGPLDLAVGPLVTDLAVGPVILAVGPVKNREETLF